MARRASQDSLVLRVFLAVRESQEEATRAPLGTEESLATRASLVFLDYLAPRDRKAPICPARFPESPENPDTPVSPDDQGLRGSLVSLETPAVQVLTVPKVKGEIQDTEDNQDPKDSRDREETPVFLVVRPLVSMVLVEKTECRVFLEPRASPERCWGPRLDLLESTASLGVPETRASPGLLEDLVHLVWMGVLECLG